MNVVEKLSPGLSARISGVVDSSNTADKMGSGDVSVFATPAMLSLMEAAAIKSIQGLLAKDYTTVGRKVDLVHLAPTPREMKVTAEAVLEKIEGKNLIFSVTAYDDKEEIGQGTHERIVVPREKFLSKAQAKKE